MEDFVSILKALADENRFRIINLLLTHDLCVGALANRLQISKAAVSQHLQVLRKAGLVKGEKRGYWTHYAVKGNVLKQVAGGLTEMSNQTPGPEGICGKTLPMATTIIREGGKRLKERPEDCTPEQIKEGHGDTREHPCETEKK